MADYYILSPEQDSVLHRVARDGTLLASFGSHRLEEDEQVLLSAFARETIRFRQNTGRLYCDEARGSVVLFHNGLLYVRAFSAAGEPLWETRLSDYRRTHHLRRGERISIAPDPESGTRNSGSIFAVLDDETIALTLHEISMRDGAYASRLELRLLSLADGRELKRITDSPATLVGVTDSLVYGSTDEPIPRILAFSR